MIKQELSYLQKRFDEHSSLAHPMSVNENPFLQPHSKIQISYANFKLFLHIGLLTPSIG